MYLPLVRARHDEQFDGHNNLHWNCLKSVVLIAYLVSGEDGAECRRMLRLWQPAADSVDAAHNGVQLMFFAVLLDK